MNLLRRFITGQPTPARDGAGGAITIAELGWASFSPAERRRLAAKYLGVAEAEVRPEGLALAADWFNGIGLAQRLSLVNAFFALGGGDGAAPARRRIWEEVARLLPGKWNSSIGEVSVILELRDPGRFRQAGRGAGMKEDWWFVRRLYHAGASFSLREWGVRASLNVANDTAAARAAGQSRGGGNIARAEFDAFGPKLGLLGLLRHKFGRLDAQLARLELARRGFIPDQNESVDAGGEGRHSEKA